MKWLEKCYVGEVHSPTMVESMQDRILEERVTSMRVIPMGVSHVLLKPMEGEDLEELINDSGGFLDNWFSRIVKWLPMEVPRERYTWIRCHGIPLHAWIAEVFESIVASLGRFITLDDNTFNMKRFDMPKMLILTSSPEAVYKVEKVRINGLQYSIRVVEELFPVVYEGVLASKKVQPLESSSESDASSDFSGHIFLECSFSSEAEFQIQNDMLQGAVEGEKNLGVEDIQEVGNSLEAHQVESRACEVRVEKQLMCIDQLKDTSVGVDGEASPQARLMGHIKHDYSNMGPLGEPLLTHGGMGSDCQDAGPVGQLREGSSGVDTLDPTPLPLAWTPCVGGGEFTKLMDCATEMAIVPVSASDEGVPPDVEANGRVAQNTAPVKQNGGVDAQKRKVGRPARKKKTKVLVKGFCRTSKELVGDSGTTISGTSISDSNINWRNWMIANIEPQETAIKVWNVGRDLGVGDQGNETEIVTRLEALEQRDPGCFGSCGGRYKARGLIVYIRLRVRGFVCSFK